MAQDKDSLEIGPGYPFAQLMRALSRGGERAKALAERWFQVLRGLANGTLKVGSRTPVKDAPAWVTLEVLHGGFATGNFAAGGPLQSHEREKLASVRAGVTERAALNRYYLTDQGRRELVAVLRSGCYRIRVPEEAVLLVVTWLLERGEADRASDLLATIEPFLDRLRFFPVPASRPIQSTDDVHVETASDAGRNLRSSRRNERVERMNEALLVWTPLYDRAVALFLETIEGDVPNLRLTGQGELERGPNGLPVIQGGWPCRNFPSGWASRARQLREDYAHAQAQHQLCTKPERPKENFARLRGYLAICEADPSRLTGRDVGTIRRILASYVTAHGAPGSDRLERTRAAQARCAQAPLLQHIGFAAAEQLSAFPPDDGVSDVAAVLKSIAGRLGIAAVPRHIARKVGRCAEASPEQLIQDRVIHSAESLARVVPQIAARVRGSSIEDVELRRVYESTYLAFRRRRSLLLLDFASQVRLGELPWIAAVEPWVGSNEASVSAAQLTLARVGALVVGSFPYTIVPNKLVTEFRALAGAARLSLPFVNELASDIFMGGFSETFLRAAHVAARRLRGSLYERYYGLPYDRVLRLNDVEKQGFGARTSPGLARLCEELAGTTDRVGWSVARNGTVIEQAQILTTHNLATLFELDEVSRSLRPRLPELARHCFEWICRELRTPTAHRCALRSAKDAAYAWRQMVFYLSLCSDPEAIAFLRWTNERLAGEPIEFRNRFEPAMAGLRVAVGGEALGASSPGRRFLGWSLGPHWIFSGA
jgi:hypothetical protein